LSAASRSLAKLIPVINDQGANILEVSNDRPCLALNAKAAVSVMMLIASNRRVWIKP
jgi:hypothetical protein